MAHNTSMYKIDADYSFDYVAWKYCKCKFGFQNAFTQMDTEVIGTLVYREGIQNGKYSLATAFGLMQGVVNLSMVLISNFISKKLSNTSIW